ncbi:MAG: NAD-dependent epimerase/dehydratase family protein [Planctomycetota bacterium]|nr:NAD-dependent epimerase/dehydratase family protein [Planctomycetota bacterium]
MAHRGPQAMKALVTGASGFVGSHLVERLLGEGAQVACLARAGSDLARLAEAGAAVIRPDWEDPAALARATDGADVVFHAAGLTRGRSAGEYMAANAAVTARLVQAAASAGVGRFVYVSSLAAAGPNPSVAPLDESYLARPSDDYGRSKLAGEAIVLAASPALPVTIVRPPAVYGPRDRNFLPLFRTARRWGVVPAIGGREKLVSFVYAADLAEGIRLAGMAPAAAGQTYFLGSGTHSMGEVVAAMAAALGRPLRLLAVPKPLAFLAGEFGQLVWALTGRSQILSRRKIRDLLQPRWTCTWGKALRELNYQPAFDLPAGMKQTVEWYVREGWIKA